MTHASCSRRAPLVASTSADTVQRGFTAFDSVRGTDQPTSTTFTCQHLWSGTSPFGWTKRHVLSTDRDSARPTEFPRPCSSHLELAFDTSAFGSISPGQFRGKLKTISSHRRDSCWKILSRLHTLIKLHLISFKT